MATTDLSNYKTLYLQTAREYIDKMLISLGQLSNDASNKEALNNLRIASHSLRSQSQVMGYENVANVAGNIEKMSDDALRGVIQLHDGAISETKKSVDKLDEILKRVQDDTVTKT